MTAFELSWLRDLFISFDKLSKPVMGISDWDDAACVDFGGKRLVLSCDGPYKKRLVMKSALIHASTDVLAKGARPLFALDTLSGQKEDVRDMAESLKKQGLRMRIPILGGNTNLESEPSASIFVVGELLLPEPIRDSGGRSGDSLLLLGEPLWGNMEERFQKAETLFEAWYEIIAKAQVNAAKDVTKGGLVNTVKELAEHSGKGFELVDLKLHKYRNLDNLLLSADSKNTKTIRNICADVGCAINEAGVLI
jgi:uncharacterized protein